MSRLLRFAPRPLSLALVVLLLPAAAAAQQGFQMTQPPAPLKVIDPAYIDRSANACVDFFDFANGAWYKNDTIPAAYSSSGVARDMSDRNELVVRSVLDQAMANRTSAKVSATERALGTFYGSCMDSTTAERAGVSPLKPRFALIDAINSRAKLLSTMATMQKEGTGVAFNYYPDVDAHDAKHYLATIAQGGLGLPGPEYYTKTDAASDSIRTAYVAHVATQLRNADQYPESAQSDARRILALETELAKVSLTPVQRRDPAATDHPMTAAQLAALTPSMRWPTYFRTIGITRPVTKLNVAEPDFFKRLNRLVDSVPLADWKAYLKWRSIDRSASWLSTPFVQEDFTFNARFSGARALLPRWKRCLRTTDALLGEALGQAYVEKTFSADARRRARAIIDDIRAAFAERVKNLDWMSPATKAQALEKLAKMREKIGYPETWRDYSSLRLTPGPFVTNLAKARAFEWRRVVNRPGMPVDTTEWDMTVPTVNAYYNPSQNEMVFPAGALAPQTFDPKADDAANYGSLGGSWAGHELTHGFDDEGRHFDAQGNLRDWWAPADSVTFSKQASLVADQFSGYLQVDTLHGNGRLTLGENIADYGGLLTAYDALQRALARNGRPGLIDGFTPEQRFFIAYAQSWRSHDRPERLRSRLMTDPHSPARWRTNGPLSNMPSFAAAFNCKPGDPMVRPPNLIPHIW